MFFFSNASSNLSDPDGVKYFSIQALYTIYAFRYKRTQFGISTGYEKLMTGEFRKNSDTTYEFREDRVPVLAAVKMRFRKTPIRYFKAQIGTALTLNSTTRIKSVASFRNDRETIGKPIIIQLSLGIEMYETEKLNLGVEIGYGYKQLSYMHENAMNPNSIFVGFNAYW